MVQILAKSIKPFRIYRNMKYLTFDLTFDLEAKITNVLFFT